MIAKQPTLTLGDPQCAGFNSNVLPRRLGVVGLVLLIIAFNAPIAAMAGFSQLSIAFGNGIGAPVSFLVAGAILITFAAGFVGMSRFIENPGAFYLFIVSGIGRSAGLAGAFLATVAYLLLCAGSYPYLGLVAVEFMTRFAGGPIFSWQVWSVIFLVIVTAIGLLRIDLAMKVLGKLVCLEIALVAIWEGAILLRGGPEGYSLGSFTPAAFSQGSAGLGILFAMLCMIGIEAAACFRAETINPDKSIARATYIAIAFMAVFYCAGSWLYIVAQGASHAVLSAKVDPVGSFFSSVQQYLGSFIVKVTSLILVTSQMVATNAVQGSASRYLFSLGRDRILPASLARVHSRLQSPHVAVLAVSAFSLLLLLTTMIFRVDPVTSFAAITGMGIYFLLPLLTATSTAVVAFYRKNPDIRASRWTKLIAPALSATALAALFVLTSINLQVLVLTRAVVIISVLSVVIVPLAALLIARFYRRSRPAIYAAIGKI